MRNLKLILAAALAALTFGVLAQPAVPLTVLSWVNPATNVDGTPLTDLASVTIECGSEQVTIPTSEAGAAVQEVLPDAVKAASGPVECSAWATDTSGNPSPRSNTVTFACGGGECFPLGTPAAPILSVQ